MSPSLRILIVEDEAILAMSLKEDLVDAGHEVVGTAASFRQAVRLAEATRPDLALVDIHLSDGPTGAEVGRAIAATGHAVVVFMTANVKRLPEDFAGAAGVIAKPYTSNGLESAVTFVRDALRGGALPPPPWSLRLAPHLESLADGRIRLGPA